MDKKALTEKRRETVIGLLKNMNIKKVAEDGFDKDDVYDCMQQLCDLYESNIEELENAYEGELNTLKDKYQKYDDNNELYVSLIMEAKKSSNEIINQAKTEVETILAEGKAEVSKQENELEQMRVGMETEKQAMNEELNAARRAVEAEKAAMRADLEAEREKLSAMKNKYNQQINAMEDEFDEIKTNILRTAGQIDSLKSKLPDDDELINWDILDTAASVDFPAENVEIEKTYDIPEAADTAEPEAAAAEAVEADVAEVTEAEETADVTEPEAQPEGQEGGLKLEDLVGPAADAGEKAEEEEKSEGIDLGDFDIELPDLEEAKPEEGGDDEISFEGLEELFADEGEKKE